MRAHKCPKYALADNRTDTARALCAQLALQVPLPKSVLIITECVPVRVALVLRTVTLHFYDSPNPICGTHNQL